MKMHLNQNKQAARLVIRDFASTDGPEARTCVPSATNGYSSAVLSLESGHRTKRALHLSPKLMQPFRGHLLRLFQHETTFTDSPQRGERK